ncbi:hypothetical protein EDD30_5369 [Couchioplanes caeruleus]|uniref:Uncharacterized protein n=1 Tax=Couchioplanes caeruleus TaxID=56438 RepID=A0A3N1GQC1_9ACTN|nr:hypothetical protein EDD30_5369 [Couchioplanes caeruleus]
MRRIGSTEEVTVETFGQAARRLRGGMSRTTNCPPSQLTLVIAVSTIIALFT